MRKFFIHKFSRNTFPFIRWTEIRKYRETREGINGERWGGEWGGWGWGRWAKEREDWLTQGSVRGVPAGSLNERSPTISIMPNLQPSNFHSKSNSTFVWKKVKDTKSLRSSWDLQSFLDFPFSHEALEKVAAFWGQNETTHEINS